MDRLAAEHERRNQLTRDAWPTFAQHRYIVTEHLVRGRTPGRDRLCVLGAGNSNDLDLESLAAVYREVHLVDLDAAALTAGVARQGLADAAAIHCLGGVDLTGILPTLAAFDPTQPPDAEELDQCIRAARDYTGPALPGPFDVVASACVLTQLLDSVVLSLDAGHSRFRELLLAVRNSHLRLLFELVAPGGLAVLFTDVVSSDTLPELATIPVAHLPNVIAEQVAQRNFFSGVNPQLLKTWFDEDATIGPAIEQVQLVRPWRWQVGPRMYAVCAVKVVRASSTAR